MRHFINITESFLQEDAATTPQFKLWFAGSKVVDKQGQPLRCYHGTYDDIERWKPLTHFGTGKAASSRIGVTYGREFSPYDEERAPRVYPVYLRITNPIRVFDDVDELDGDQLIWQALNKLVKRRLVKRELYDHLMRKIRFEDEEAARLEAMNIVAQHGFDGLIYRNKVEHAGSTSWVIFDDGQVWPAFGPR